MNLFCVGISHRRAPLALREQLAFGSADILSAIDATDCRKGASGLVILSTCNRVELYAATPALHDGELVDLLCRKGKLTPEALRTYLYHYHDEAVITHLLQVAAGLDSMVLGEPQILGQISRALQLSQEQSAAGLALTRLFQSALRAGKRARTETAIAHQPASIASLVIQRITEKDRPLSRMHIVVLGAGEMAELTLAALSKRGVGQLSVANRRFDHAQALACRWNARAERFEALADVLTQADALIASTGAPHTVVDAGMIAAAMRQRPDRPLTLIDLAVPRNIDPQAAGLPRVRLLDLDHLQADLERTLAERASEIPHVEAILSEEKAGLVDFLASLEVRPLIATVHERAESIRRAELQKTLRRLPDLTDAERARISALTRALVKKLLDRPTQCLLAKSSHPHAAEHVDLARELFGLEGEP